MGKILQILLGFAFCYISAFAADDSKSQSQFREAVKAKGEAWKGVEDATGKFVESKKREALLLRTESATEVGAMPHWWIQPQVGFGTYSHLLSSDTSSAAFGGLAYNLSLQGEYARTWRMRVPAKLRLMPYTFSGLPASSGVSALSGVILEGSVGLKQHLLDFGDRSKEIFLYIGYNLRLNSPTATTPVQMASYQRHAFEFGASLNWYTDAIHFLELGFICSPAFVYAESPATSGGLKSSLSFALSGKYRAWEPFNGVMVSVFLDAYLQLTGFHGTGSRQLTNASIRESHILTGAEVSLSL